jgi:hypothetical protein
MALRRAHRFSWSVQRALLGEVSSTLRGVSLIREGDGLEKIRFYVDGPITAEDRESASGVAAEVAADLPPPGRVEERIERVDAPAPLPPDAVWAYRRREARAG